MIRNKTILIIQNPVSGNRHSKKRSREFLALLEKSFDNITLLLTKRKGSAKEYVEEYLSVNSYDYLIGIGGDGTNNEIINGIMELSESQRTKVCYSLFPTGTGNDWARGMNIPLDPNQWMKMLLKGSYKLHDLGLVQYKDSGKSDKRYFINVAGMAYDAYLVKKLEEGFMPKKNKLVYLSMLLRCLVSYRLHKARVVSKEFSFESKCYTLNVGVNRFAGGGMEIVPSANPFDGLLSFTAARDLKKYEVVLELKRFYNGTYEEHPKIEAFSSEEIQVECLDKGRTMELEVDGEYVGEAPCTFFTVKEAINVLVP
jgi:diacylglycerol kinase (ATP)